MFWKKKKEPSEWVRHDSDDQRDAFRYTPKSDDYIRLEITGITISVVNLSAGGILFSGAGCRSGDCLSARLFLKTETGENCLDIVLDILGTDAAGNCRSRIRDPDTGQQDAIHQFLLERQKQDLLERKNRDTPH